MRLDLSNNRLTAVPKQIHLFPPLARINLINNQITTIKSGDFNFTISLDNLRTHLTGNEIRSIEPNAFLGIYNQ